MASPCVALATWSTRLPLADEEDALVADALRVLGIEVQRPVWDRDAIEADLCVIRTTWDYVERLDKFLAWVAASERARPLWNPGDVIRWNTHKRYLLDLDARGVPVPETVLASHADPVRTALDRGWSRVMIKPAVGVGAIGSLAADVADETRIREHVADLAHRGDVLLQEYITSVHTAGESSLVFFDGVLSHAVRKIPAKGDYRAHPYWGATVSPLSPSNAQLDAALAAIRAVPRPPLYARVDLLERDDGAPLLIELELIEPYLFLDATTARTFARAIAERVSR